MKSRPVADRRPRWASLPNAAEHFDCSVDTIRRYIAAGYLTGHRAPNGKTIRVDLNEIDDMMRPIPAAATSSTRRAS